MAFNFGAFAGAATNSALNTYERLGEEELRDMQRKQLRDQIAREDKERAIAAETFGNVGQNTEYQQGIATEGKTNTAQAKALSDQGRTGDPEFDRAMAESAAGALRENAARQGVAGAESPMQAMRPEAYTEKQAYADYSRKMAGVDSKAARAARVEGLQLSDLDRKERQQVMAEEAGQEMRGFLVESKDFAEKNGLPAAVAKYGFGIPGMNIALATGKDGNPVVNVLGEKGKVTSTIPLTQENYFKYISQLAEKKFVDKMSTVNFDYYAKGKQLGIEQDKADTEKDFKVGRNGMPGVYERVSSASDAAKITAARAGNNGRLTPIGVSADGSQMLMSDGTARALPAGFNKDDIFPKNSGVKNEWAEVEKELVKQGNNPAEIAAQQTAFFSRRGYAPPALVAVLETGINPTTKKPFTETDISAFKAKYPNTPINVKAQEPAAPGAPASAIPTAPSKQAYTPPAGSKAAKSAENRAAAQEKAAAPSRAAQASFNQDATSLEPLALVQKYDSKRGLLSSEQLRTLKAAEQKL